MKREKDLLTVPELLFNITPDAPIHPIRDSFFPLIGDSLEVLNASLLVSAANNPTFSRGEMGRTRLLIQKGKTIGVINQALQRGPTALKDEVVYAVATTALSEDRLGNFESSRIHLDGLKRMIKLRGGIKSVRKSFPLCGVLAWAEISVSNKAAPLVHSQDSNEASRGASPPTPSVLEAREEEEIFCQFLSRLRKVQLSKRRSYNPANIHSREDTSFLLRNGSPLLTMLGDSDPDSGVITSISRMNANNCQLASLFYINFMLCEFHGAPQLTTAFLARLSWLVLRHGQGKAPRAGLFVWVIAHEITQDEDWERGVNCLEWLIRMIRVARRLSAESSQMLHRALLDSLKTHESVDAGLLVSNDFSILASRIEMGVF